MATISKSFTAVGVGTELFVKHGSLFTFNISGTWVGTVALERTRNAGLSYEVVASFTTNQTLIPVNVSTPDQGPASYRFRCSAFTSGTIVTVLKNAEQLDPKFKKVLCGTARVAAGAGWVVPQVANIFRMATLPASQTASILTIGVVDVVPVGAVIKGCYLTGQIESGGNAVTVDLNLRKTTAAAADLVDTSIASSTQLSVTADAVMSSSNTLIFGLDEVVGDSDVFYALVTATTGAACDIDLQGLVVVYEEPKF
jgi:hypothetical protein